MSDTLIAYIHVMCALCCAAFAVSGSGTLWVTAAMLGVLTNLLEARSHYRSANA